MQNGYCRHENYIYFGTYPQTKVTDTTIINSLKSLAGTLPTASNSQKWTSYKYYIEGSNTTDYMWYIDIEYNGDKYRGVYFSSYRPYWCGYSSSVDHSCQDDNGYYVNTLYWFLYEPIKWRILEESNGYATILAELVLDSQHYYHDDYKGTKTRNGSSVYANNYAESEIREWLNNTFYNTAFNTLQQGLIQTVNVENSARSTNPHNDATYYGSGENSYACNNTNDKIWLLSGQEVTRASYGFSTSTGNNNTRGKSPTDYAKSQGVHTYNGNGCWWLRSPRCDLSFNAQYVADGGNSNCSSYVGSTHEGVVPALKIKLS